MAAGRTVAFALCFVVIAVVCANPSTDYVNIAIKTVKNGMNKNQALVRSRKDMCAKEITATNSWITAGSGLDRASRQEDRKGLADALQNRVKGLKTFLGKLNTIRATLGSHITRVNKVFQAKYEMGISDQVNAASILRALGMVLSAPHDPAVKPIRLPGVAADTDTSADSPSDSSAAPSGSSADSNDSQLVATPTTGNGTAFVEEVEMVPRASRKHRAMKMLHAKTRFAAKHAKKHASAHKHHAHVRFAKKHTSVNKHASAHTHVRFAKKHTSVNKHASAHKHHAHVRFAKKHTSVNKHASAHKHHAHVRFAKKHPKTHSQPRTHRTHRRSLLSTTGADATRSTLQALESRVTVAATHCKAEGCAQAYLKAFELYRKASGYLARNKADFERERAALGAFRDGLEALIKKKKAKIGALGTQLASVQEALGRAEGAFADLWPAIKKHKAIVTSSCAHADAEAAHSVSTNEAILAALGSGGDVTPVVETPAAPAPPAAAPRPSPALPTATGAEDATGGTGGEQTPVDALVQ